MGRFTLLVVSVLAFLAAAAKAQTPLTTAFTYQGELASEGIPATGAHDLRFRLYDAATGGNQIGDTICSDDLAITEGRFTVTLDFGAAFAGQKRFLEIEVRQDTGLDCSDATGFTRLTPRQELTAAPNASFAQIAATAATAATAGDAASFNGHTPSFYQNAANLTGTLADAQLSSNVARLNSNQTFTGLLNFTNAGNTFAGSGAGLTNLSGASINAGTLARSSLSADVQSGVGTLVPDLSLVGSALTDGQPNSVAVSGSFAYVVNANSSTLRAFDISNPAAPTFAGSVGTAEVPAFVAVSGSFAYVVNAGSNSLQVFNISNPAAPTLAGSVGTGYQPYSVAVSGSFAYVVSYNSNTLQVFDVSNPGAPTLVGSVATGSNPFSVAVSGSFAYVANYDSNTLQVFNISNPAAPTLAGSVATGNFPSSVAVSGSFAYVVGQGSNTLQVFNISSPAAITMLGSVATESAPLAVAVSGSFAYVVSQGSNTLQAFNISNPGAITLAGSAATASSPRCITVSGSYGYVVNGNSATLQIFKSLGVGFGTPLAASSLAGVNGSGLTNLNASNITTGILADGLLSSNIPRLNVNNTFTGGDQTFAGRIRVNGGIITDGTNGISTADLGLYSQRPGFFLRFVTSGGGFVWYTDGATSPAGGSARMQLTSGGNLSVVGSLSKGGGSFKIDHPLDPENKYLYHSFVESPDMMNVYNGNITTGADGYATITLPDYFEALNRDFRYQLTVIDESDDMDVFLWAKVVREVKDNQFTVRSSRGNLKVSWQVTGIRKDAWAEKNRIPNSVDKVGNERGKYLHPEAFDKPASQSIPSSTAPASESERE